MAITMEELRRKAQRYEEALEKAKRLYEKGTITESLCHIFPELKESEDEEIRKELMDFVVDNTICQDGRREKWIAWLEKQGERKEATCVAEIIDHLTEKEQEILFKELEMQKEQKPAEWSEEDEKNLQGILDEIKANKSEAPEYDIDTYNRFIDWLKSLKDRVGCEANCTTTKEWGEEDEKMLDNCINALGDSSFDTYEIEEWVKSLKQRIGG